MKKVFSQKDGTLKIVEGFIELWDNRILVASGNTKRGYINIVCLPSTLIRKPKTDEELAEEYVENSIFQKNFECALQHKSFLAGRKSVGGEYHLSREQINSLINDCLVIGTRLSVKGCEDSTKLILSQFISSLTPSIFPTTIEVEYDGSNYDWSTLKANYEN